MKKTLVTGIKFTSIVLISLALCLESWHFLLPIQSHYFFHEYSLLLWLGRFAVIAHAIEGLIAAYFAPSKGKNPFRYATYTFFVGTIGLIELFNPEHLHSEINEGSQVDKSPHLIP